MNWKNRLQNKGAFSSMTNITPIKDPVVPKTLEEQIQAFQQEYNQAVALFGDHEYRLKAMIEEGNKRTIEFLQQLREINQNAAKVREQLQAAKPVEAEVVT